MQLYNGLMPACGRQVFTRKVYADIVIDSLKYCQQNKGLKIHAWCIMSNHLHLIISVNESNKLSDVLRDFKKFTSVKILEAIKASSTESRKEFLLWHFGKAGRANPNNTHFQLWQQHSHPIELNTNEKVSKCLHYIHQNPVEAGIVLSQEDYLYSSAANYAGLPETLIDVILIE